MSKSYPSGNIIDLPLGFTLERERGLCLISWNFGFDFVQFPECWISRGRRQMFVFDFVGLQIKIRKRHGFGIGANVGV